MTQSRGRQTVIGSRKVDVSALTVTNRRLVCAVLVAVTWPGLARAEIINPGIMISGYLFSAWGIPACLLLGWPAVHVATGRTWARSFWPTLVVKTPTALLGPVLLFLTGGFVLSFAPLALAANVTTSAAMYTLLDVTALRIGLKTRPSRLAAVALFVANLALLASAMIAFAMVERELLVRIRSAG